MISTNGISNVQSYYGASVQKQSRNMDVDHTKATDREAAVRSSEDKLSDTAKSYLDNLRKSYGDYDFIVADAGDDKKALLGQSNKEFSIIFSSTELEKMAKDEKYASEKLQQMENAVKLSEKISARFDSERAWGSDVGINRIGIELKEDGSVSIFAELEKSSNKQRELMEKAREKRAEEKKEQVRKVSEKKYEDLYNKKDDAVKRTVVEAGTESELFDKIGKIDWSKIQSESINAGNRFDMSV